MLGDLHQMSTETLLCDVLDDNVSVVSDEHGKVANVVCPHFVQLTHGCMLKAKRMRPVSYMLKRIVDKIAGTRVVTCVFGDPNENPLSKSISGVSSLLAGSSNKKANK